MAYTVTKVGSEGPRITVGQHDLELYGIVEELGGQFGDQLKFDWIVVDENSTDEPDHLWDYISITWGTVKMPSNLRKRVYALAGGRLNNVIDQIIDLDPEAIDLEFFVGGRIVANVVHKTSNTGKVRAKIDSAMGDRATAERAGNDFLESIKDYNEELHRQVTASLAPLTAAAPRGRGLRVPPPAEQAPLDDGVPF